MARKPAPAPTVKAASTQQDAPTAAPAKIETRAPDSAARNEAPEPVTIAAAAPALEGQAGAAAQPGATPPRAKRSGFSKENYDFDRSTVREPREDVGKATEHDRKTTVFQPGQTLVPVADSAVPVVVNSPYGSEPASLDTKTGTVKSVAHEPDDEADAASGQTDGDDEKDAA